MKESKVKLSHKTPQFLLRNFVSRVEGKEFYINQFNKNLLSSSFENNIDKVGENYYYKVDLNSIDTLEQEIVDLEAEFEKVESATAPIIKKIIDKKSIADLTINEKKQIAVFIACQILRTDSYRQHLQNQLNDEKELFINISKQYEKNLASDDRFKRLKKLTETKDGKKLYHILALLGALYPYSVKLSNDFIENKDWLLFESNQEKPFIIGDNPVIYVFKRPRLLLDNDQQEFYLPLSNNLTLAIWDKSFNQNLQDQENKISLIKQNLAKNYKSLENDLRNNLNKTIEEYEKGMDLLGIINLSSNAIQNFRTFTLSSKKVKELNQWQLNHSHKFVYSSKSTLDLENDKEAA